MSGEEGREVRLERKPDGSYRALWTSGPEHADASLHSAIRDVYEALDSRGLNVAQWKGRYDHTTLRELLALLLATFDAAQPSGSITYSGRKRDPRLGSSSSDYTLLSVFSPAPHPKLDKFDQTLLERLEQAEKEVFDLRQSAVDLHRQVDIARHYREQTDELLVHSIERTEKAESDAAQLDSELRDAHAQLAQGEKERYRLEFQSPEELEVVRNQLLEASLKVARLKREAGGGWRERAERAERDLEGALEAKRRLERGLGSQVDDLMAKVRASAEARAELRRATETRLEEQRAEIQRLHRALSQPQESPTQSSMVVDEDPAVSALPGTTFHFKCTDTVISFARTPDPNNNR